MRCKGPVAALLAALVATSSAGAQLPEVQPRPDTAAGEALAAPPIVAVMPATLAPVPPPAPPAPRRVLSGRAYVVLLGAGVGANAAWPISRDAGLLKDRWDGKDKGVHAIINFAIAQSALEAGVRPWLAWTGACGAGAAYEVTQGYVSYKDVVANCVGAGAAVLWRRYWRGH